MEEATYVEPSRSSGGGAHFGPPGTKLDGRTLACPPTLIDPQHTHQLPQLRMDKGGAAIRSVTCIQHILLIGLHSPGDAAVLRIDLDPRKQQKTFVMDRRQRVSDVQPLTGDRFVVLSEQRDEQAVVDIMAMDDGAVLQTLATAAMLAGMYPLSSAARLMVDSFDAVVLIGYPVDARLHLGDYGHHLNQMFRVVNPYTGSRAYAPLLVTLAPDDHGVWVHRHSRLLPPLTEAIDEDNLPMGPDAISAACFNKHTGVFALAHARHHDAMESTPVIECWKAGGKLNRYDVD